MDSVQCSECGNQYDSEEHPFCPRCGSLGKSESVGATATTISNRNHPKRRRAQLSGIIMATLGGITGILFIALLFLAPSLVPEALTQVETESGGPLSIIVPAGAEAAFYTLNGTFLQAVPLENGTATVDMPQAALTLEVQQQNETWTWTVFHLGQGGDVLTFESDLTSTSGDQGLYQGSLYIRGTQLLVGVLAVVSLFTVFGGIQAARLKQRGIAFAAAIVGALPWFILFFIAPNVATGLVMASFLLAAAFIQGAKEHFQ